MHRFSVVLIVSLLTIVACGGPDKSESPSNTNKVNPIKTVKAAAQEAKTTTSKSSASKDQDSSGATPEQLAKAAELLEQVDQPEIDQVDSKKLFKMHCSICHGFKGDMMINGAKDLVKSRITTQEAVAQIYHGKGLMTPYKGVLKDAEIIAVAKYAETLRR